MENKNTKTYSIVIETLKNMYATGKIELTRIHKLFIDKKISKKEYDYIISK